MAVLRTLMLALLLALAAAAPASAITYTVDVAVDDTGDTTCDVGSCPLSAAIDDANNDGTVSDIDLAVDVDSAVGFPTTITQPVTIDGDPDANGIRARIIGPNNGNGVGLNLTVNGGTPSVIRNVVIGDFFTGIWQQGTAPLHVQGSLVGIGANNVSLSNTIGVDASGGGPVTVGGTNAALRNVLAENGTDIRITAGSNHVIEGNFLGTTVDGLATGGGSGTAIELSGAGTVADVRIGGPTTASRNVIAGATYGLFLTGQSTGTEVENNYIGVDASGTSALGFSQTGIVLQGVDGNVIGSPGAGNVISGAAVWGIAIEPGSSDNLIQGNRIGTLADGGGSTATGNKQGGIRVSGPDSTNKIGGTAAGQGNLVAFNGLNAPGGIILFGDSQTEVSGNTMQGNVGVAPIDLAANNVADANDPGDVDTNADVFGFANNMQNHPVIGSATGSAGSTVVSGTLDSLPAHSFRLEFFGGPACAASGSNETEAQVFLGSTTVMTDAFGQGTFTNVALPGFAGGGVRATAIDTTLGPTFGDTSELSTCVLKAAASADVSLGITHAPATVQAGQPVTFSFLVSNAGPSTANGTLTGTITGANVSAVSPPPGIDCSASFGNTISCTGSVPATGAGTVAVTAVPPAAGIASAEGTVSAAEDATPGNNSASDSVTVTAPPEPTPTPTPSPEPTPQPTPAPTTEPKLGETVGAAPEDGTVRVKRPGSDEFVPLQAGEPIPVGTVVDARKGRVAITAEGADGQTQTADFYAGTFKVTQQGSGLTELALQGPLCKARASVAEPLASSAAKRKKKRKRSRRTTRRLWGDGTGDFRTRGRYGTATVQGTRWLTEDRCDGTNFKVAQGSVKVRDLVRKKNVTVKAPRSYLARPKR